MRVLMVNWAPIREGTAKGGGVNGYCQALALELSRSGHEVVSLSSGLTYEPETGGRRPGPCRIMRHQDWRGLRIYEAINSPVLAPSIHQFRDPMGEVSAPALEARVAELSAELRPDVVHFHNLEGFSIGCVEALRRGRAPGEPGPDRAAPVVFFSLHNYHTICSQVNLLRAHRVPCFTFENGHACVHCVEAPDPCEARLRIMRGKGAFAPMFPGMPLGVRRMLWAVPGLKKAARALKNRLRTRRFFAAIGGPPPEAIRPTWVALTNSVEPEPPSTLPPNDYARRRAAMIRMLNSCDAVLAVSDFVRRKFEAMGVDPAVISTVHIGTRINDIARRVPRPPPPPMVGADGTPRPIRLIFLGFNHYSKGLPMLGDALALLVPEVLARIDLTVYALGGEGIEDRFRRLGRRLAGLTFRPGYRFEEVPRIVAGQDIGIVPSVWWDNGPQTVFEFLGCGVPVLGAEVGGIPDFVRDGHNGLLFRANDRYDLARRLAEIVRNPGILEELRKNVRPPKDMGAHASEMLRFYERAISSSAAPDEPGTGIVTRARPSPSAALGGMP